jgi:hypothetical protein
MNCDGTFNAEDSQSFAMALRDLEAYFNSTLTFTSASGDLDGLADGNFHPNGRIDVDDIDDFVSLMAGAGAGVTRAQVLRDIRLYGQVPEPGTTLYALSCFVAGIAHWRPRRARTNSRVIE